MPASRRASPGSSRARANPATSPLDASLFFKLVRLVNITARPFTEHVGREQHLALNDWRVMMVVANHPGITATEVCQRTGMDKMSMSRAVAALAARKRLLRLADANDGRRALLRLSSAGARLYQRIAATARVRERQLFDGIGEEETARLSATLDHLIDRLNSVDEEAEERPQADDIRRPPPG